MSKCLSSPCSGLAFVSQGTGNHVAELFDVLVNDIKSYKDEREKSEINYDLLRRGDLSETRFVLGKVILETLGVELVQKNVIKLEDIEKTCDSMVKLHPLAKNDVKSILELMGSSHSPDDKLNLLHKSMVKSRKRKTSDNLQDAVKENSAKPKGTSVEEKLFNVAKHHPVAKKDVKWILSPKRKIAFVENNHPCQQEMDIKDKYASRNRCKEAFEKNLNTELSNLPAEKLLGKILEKFQQRKVSDRLQDSIKDKTTKLKEKLTNGKGSQSSQSSLFR